MITVDVRKQGGAAVMTIPADILKMLNISVGSALSVQVEGDGFVVRPAERSQRKRYSLAQLLEGADASTMQQLNDETAWAREGGAMGRELT